MAKKQEQERAGDDVTEVAPGVLRMQLPISIPGLGHVNCYALIDGDGACLVDPGLPGPGSWSAIQDRLKKADLETRHVHSVIVTHSHPDHFGGASRFAKENGAKVIAHSAFRFGPVEAADAPEVSVDDLDAQREAAAGPDAGTAPAVVDHAQMMQRGRTPWGGERPRPPFKTRMRWRMMRLLGKSSFVPTVTHRVGEGDVLELAGREWRVVHTPGHTDDHFCLHDQDLGTFLAGDHVLPTITPHISGLSTHPDPLDAFFDSLEKVARIEGTGRVLPAHGHPFDDLAARCADIREHHVGRLDRVKAIGRDIGSATVAAYSHKLFRQRSWGPMAESETYAHLEHLHRLGQAARGVDAEGRFLYETG